jgi:hypothetical protein
VSKLGKEQVMVAQAMVGRGTGAVHVAFEEGTQAQWLRDLLSPRVSRVVVCNRRGTPRQGNKGDQVDSAQLSALLRTGQLRAVYHGRPDRLVLKELTRAGPARKTLLG